MAEIVCPHCHFAMPPAVAFCPACGSFVGSSDTADVHERVVRARSSHTEPSAEVPPAPADEEPVDARPSPSAAPTDTKPPVEPRPPVRREPADPYPSDTALGRRNGTQTAPREPAPRGESRRREPVRRGAALLAAGARVGTWAGALSHRTVGLARGLGPMPVVVGILVGALLVSGGVFYLYGDARDPGAAHRVQRDPAHMLALSKPDATCAAPASVNASEEKVRFGPHHLVDGKTSTAWRCAGDGSDQKVTFTLPRRMRVTKLALVPGWATKDKRSNANRFAENGAPKAVTWHLAGRRVKQRIGHPEPTWSALRLKKPQSARKVTLTIDAVRAGNRRDMVAVSEVRVYGRRR